MSGVCPHSTPYPPFHRPACSPYPSFALQLYAVPLSRMFTVPLELYAVPPFRLRRTIPTCKWRPVTANTTPPRQPGSPEHREVCPPIPLPAPGACATVDVASLLDTAPGLCYARARSFRSASPRDESPLVPPAQSWSPDASARSRCGLPAFRTRGLDAVCVSWYPGFTGRIMPRHQEPRR